MSRKMHQTTTLRKEILNNIPGWGEDEPNPHSPVAAIGQLIVRRPCIAPTLSTSGVATSLATL